MSDFLRFKEETQEVTVNEEAYNLKLIRQIKNYVACSLIQRIMKDYY